MAASKLTMEDLPCSGYLDNNHNAQVLHGPWSCGKMGEGEGHSFGLPQVWFFLHWDGVLEQSVISNLETEQTTNKVRS